MAACAVVLHGIRQQVEHHLLDAHAVGKEADVAEVAKFERDAAGRCQWLDQVAAVGHDIDEPHWLERQLHLA